MHHGVSSGRANRALARLGPALGLLALTMPAPAGEQVVILDPAATQIAFELGATMHTVRGSFRLTQGEVRFDPADGSASGRVTIDASSGESGNRKRDRKMHDQVLESATYPEIVFAPVRIEGPDLAGWAGAIRVEGTLSIHGTSRPLVLEGELVREDGRLEAALACRIPFVEWGMTDPSVFLLRVEKHVDLTIRAVGRPARIPAGAVSP